MKPRGEINLLVLWIIISHAKYCPFGAAVHEEKCGFHYISLYKILILWGRAIHDPRDFIWTNLNPLSQRMIHTKYQCIPASGSWEEYFEYLIKIILILPVIGPQKRPVPLLNKFPSPKHVFYQVWLKLASWFLRRFLSIFLYITM